MLYLIIGILVGVAFTAVGCYFYFNQLFQKKLKKHTNTQRSVIKGQIAEQLYPMTPQCPYHISDMRFIGNPIDYIVFNGYTNSKDGECRVEEVIFLEVKSGSARLSQTQRAIRDAINSGRVKFDTVNTDRT